MHWYRLFEGFGPFVPQLLDDDDTSYFDNERSFALKEVDELFSFVDDATSKRDKEKNKSAPPASPADGAEAASQAAPSSAEPIGNKLLKYGRRRKGFGSNRSGSHRSGSHRSGQSGGSGVSSGGRSVEKARAATTTRELQAMCG